MALQMDFKSRLGITIPNAYIKVSEILNLRKDHGLAVVSAYVDAEKSPEQYIEQTGIEFPFDLEGKNAIAQAYDFIKGLPEFADAVDA